MQMQLKAKVCTNKRIERPSVDEGRNSGGGSIWQDYRQISLFPILAREDAQGNLVILPYQRQNPPN
jgi:hypothetical protein